MVTKINEIRTQALEVLEFYKEVERMNNDKAKEAKTVIHNNILKFKELFTKANKILKDEAEKEEASRNTPAAINGISGIQIQVKLEYNEAFNAHTEAQAAQSAQAAQAGQVTSAGQVTQGTP
jgi:hypothetical protein